MTLLALILVFVPFVAPPGLLFPSYTQPVPLLLGWIYLAFAYKLFPIKLFSVCFTFFLFYIIVLRFLMHREFSLTIDDQSVLIAYCFGFFQLSFLLSLFKKAFRKLRNGNFFLADQILNSARLTILIVATTSILQLFPVFSDFLTYVKPKHFELGVSLNFANRGLSGILPEPSYVGTSCAVMIIIVYWFSFRIFLEKNNPSRIISSSSNSSSSPIKPQRVGEFQFYPIYSSYLVSFLACKQNLFAVIASSITVSLAFSPASFISFLFILFSVFIPPFLGLYRHKVSMRWLLYFPAAIAFILLLTFSLYSLFPGMRLSSTINGVIEQGLYSLIDGSDASSADRTASSVAGLFSIFYHPLGLGLNGHRALFADCSDEMIIHFNLLCGSIYSSSRNHNALATYLQDGGLVGIYSVFLAFGSSFTKLFAQNFRSFSWVGRLSLVYLFFIFVVLPSPLGAPSVWIAIALIISFFSVPFGLESNDCSPNV